MKRKAYRSLKRRTKYNDHEKRIFLLTTTKQSSILTILNYTDFSKERYSILTSNRTEQYTGHLIKYQYTDHSLNNAAYILINKLVQYTDHIDQQISMLTI